MRTCEGGVSTASCVTDDGPTSGDRSGSSYDASAIGAHGVIDEQPSGAQGSLQGAWSCAGASPGGFSTVSGMSIPAMLASDMAIVAIAGLDECPISGITHAKPLPTNSTWAKTALISNAVSRRVCRIVLPR